MIYDTKTRRDRVLSHPEKTLARLKKLGYL